MSQEKTGTGHGEVTTKPAISTDEAAQTDEVVGSPVGDEVTTIGAEPIAPGTLDEPEAEPVADE